MTAAPATDTAQLWLSCARRSRQGNCVTDYMRLHVAQAIGPVPPGVPLYRTRALAKLATARALDIQQTCKPTPAHLVPAATT